MKAIREWQVWSNVWSISSNSVGQYALSWKTADGEIAEDLQNHNVWKIWIGNYFLLLL